MTTLNYRVLFSSLVLFFFVLALAHLSLSPPTAARQFVFALIWLPFYFVLFTPFLFVFPFLYIFLCSTVSSFYRGCLLTPVHRAFF